MRVVQQLSFNLAGFAFANSMLQTIVHDSPGRRNQRLDGWTT